MLVFDTASGYGTWDNIISSIKSFSIKYGVRILGALAVLVFGFWLARLIVKQTAKSRWFNKMDKDYRGFAISAIKALLYFAVIILVVLILGIPMASVAAIIASCGVTIGLALQGSLANLAGGMMLLLFKPFKVGDYIVTGNYEGTVDEINIFSTSLTTLDNRRVVLPNASLSNSSLVNLTDYPERMVDLVVCADCDAPIDLVTKVLYDMAEKQPQRLKDKDIVSRFCAFGDSCAKYQLRVWCRTEDYWTLYYALQDGAKRALTDNNIKIPYPILEVKPSDDRQY